MYNLLIKILILILGLSTITAFSVKPPERKSVMIYSSEFKMVPVENTSITKNDIPTQMVDKTVMKNSQQQPITKTEQKIARPIFNKFISKQNQPQKVKTNTVKSPSVNKLDSQEVTTTKTNVDWSRWRSNLQNRIMEDTKLPILPIGTVFKFTFDVDKYRRISNIQTWSTDSRYTPYAIQYIAPVIKSYQSQAILEFPQGSDRTFTTIKGAWKISNISKYSTKNDYNDVESVSY